MGGALNVHAKIINCLLLVLSLMKLPKLKNHVWWFISAEHIILIIESVLNPSHHLVFLCKSSAHCDVCRETPSSSLSDD